MPTTTSQQTLHVPMSFIKLRIPKHKRRSWSSIPDVPNFSDGFKHKENQSQEENGGCHEASCTSRKKRGRLSIQHNFYSQKIIARIESLRFEADELHEEGKLFEAESKYCSAIDLSGLWMERTLMSSIHFNLAVCMIKGKRYDNAVIQAEMAIKLEPSFSNAYYLLGHALSLTGNMPRAIRTFKMMIKLKPNIRIAIPNSGQLFGPSGNPKLDPSEVLIIYKRPICDKLPPNWVCRESRSQPGHLFFENLISRETSWIRPPDQQINLSSGKRRKLSTIDLMPNTVLSSIRPEPTIITS